MFKSDKELCIVTINNNNNINRYVFYTLTGYHIIILCTTVLCK